MLRKPKAILNILFVLLVPAILISACSFVDFPGDEFQNQDSIELADSGNDTADADETEEAVEGQSETIPSFDPDVYMMFSTGYSTGNISVQDVSLKVPTPPPDSGLV